MKQYKHRSRVDADWERSRVVEGVLVGIEKLPASAGERRFMVLDTGESLIRVYESKDLEECFAASEPGDHVRIEFLDKIDLDGGRTLNKFNASVWTE